MEERAHQDEREVAAVHPNRQEAASSPYPGPRQILQCTVDHFESFDQGAKAVVGIAERYVAGHLEANDLQRERDAQMVAHGITEPSRGKNFAANHMPSSS